MLKHGLINIFGAGTGGGAGGSAGVTSIEGLSGIIDLDSTDGSIAIDTTGQVIRLVAAQTSFNGISGVGLLVSPNDGIVISTSGQTAFISGLMTTASGALINQIVSDAGQTSVEGLSGVVDLDSPDESILIGVNGQTIELSGLFTPESGILVNRQIHERRWQGHISGLELSINTADSGLFDVAAGVAYVSGIRIALPAQIGLDPQFLPGSGTGCGLQVAFVGLNADGSITTSIDTIHTHEEQATLIDLGLLTAWDPASPNSGLIQFVHSERPEILNADYNRISWVEFAVGAVISSGIIVTDNGSLTLAASDGVFYDRHQNRHLHELDVPLEFFEIYRGLDGVYRIQAEATLVNNTQYDSGAGLVPLTGSRWATHTLWFDIVRDFHFMVISEDQYNSLQIAQDAPLNPGCIADFSNVMPIAKVVIQRNQTVIGGSTGRIVDVRPIIGARAAIGTTTTVTTATTLQQAYENSAEGEIALDNVRGPLSILDNVASLSADGLKLFEVFNSDRSTEYFGVSISGIHSPSGRFASAVGIGPGASDSPQCMLDVSGLICASGLAISHNRPTISGIGLALLTELIPDTQTSVEGLSGVVDLDSPNGGINIGTTGQVIELTIPVSGAPSGAAFLLAEYDSPAHLTSARILTGSSGIRIDDQGARSTSGLALTLDFDNEPSVNQVLTWNGTKLQWANQTGGGGGEIDTQTSVEGLSGVIDLLSPNDGIHVGVHPIIDQTIIISGLMTTASGVLINQIVSDAGQTSVEGLSGVIDLSSPNSSINIGVNGQTIELTIPVSGAPSGAAFLLAEYDSPEHLTSARILSATSGIRLDDQGARSTSGIALTLDFDNEPSGQLRQELRWDGDGLQWVSSTRKAKRTFTMASGLQFVIQHDLDTTDWTWSMWRDLDDVAPSEEILIPDNIYPSGLDHVVIEFTSTDAFPSGYDGRVVLVG